MDFQTTIAAQGNPYHLSEKLDSMWPLILDTYEEDWRVDVTGDLVLEVDEALLTKILDDNYAVAYYQFGALKLGMRADGTRFYTTFPSYLLGTYIIKGVYDAKQRFINHARRYYFVQEGF